MKPNHITLDHKKALIYILLSNLSFALMSITVKDLKYIPITQVTFFRCFIALLIALIFLKFKDRINELKTRNIRLHVIRAFFGFSAMLFVFKSYQIIEIAKAQAFVKTHAFFISFFGIFLLKENFSSAKIIALFLGFLGIIIMLDPGAPSLEYGVLIALVGSILGALAITTVKVLSKYEQPLVIVTYFMFFGSIASLSFYPDTWITPKSFELIKLLTTGIFGILGQIFLVTAYKYGDASFLGPYAYSELLWATLLGFFIWGEIPTSMLVLGISLIITSQIYLYRKER